MNTLKTLIFSRMDQLSDIHIIKNIPLPSPKSLCQEVSRTEEQAAFILRARQTIEAIIWGQDKRLMVVLGPCSIHDVEAALDYAKRLSALAKKVEDQLYLVMRVYFEKPRTSLGWKGLIMDPNLDNSGAIEEGLYIARKVLRDIINLGLPTATELLDPITPQYIADLTCWAAIGARTTESQTHRQMASGLSMPLGFKNTTSGDMTAAINAIKAAEGQQTFLGVNSDGVASAVTTNGNRNCHLVLRGGSDAPNYDKSSVDQSAKKLEENGLQKAIMVDASHANSNKDYRKQPEVFRNVIAQACEPKTPLIGVMLESNLVAGNQAFPQPKEDLVYGQSITDACIDWKTTEEIILEAHKALSLARQ